MLGDGLEPLSLGVETLSLGVEPLSLGVEPLSLGVEPLSLGMESVEGCLVMSEKQHMVHEMNTYCTDPCVR